MCRENKLFYLLQLLTFLWEQLFKELTTLEEKSESVFLKENDFECSSLALDKLRNITYATQLFKGSMLSLKWLKN